MRNRFPHGGEVLGASPANPVLAPYPLLDRSLSMSRQRELLDLQAIQRIPGLVGYWKSDPQYLFEDSAGTTPASTSGTGPVGQWLPVNGVVTFGANLYTFGDFESGIFGGISDGSGSVSTWTLNTVSPISGAQDGRLVITTSASNRPIFVAQNVSSSIAVGRTYRYSFSYKVNSGAVIIASANDGTSTKTLGVTLSGSGSFSFDLTCAAANGTFGYLYFGNSLCDAQFDNFTLQEYKGAAFQSTTANKPILRKTPTTGVYWADSNTATSALNVALGNLGSACTVARSSAEGVTFTENVSITAPYNIAPAFSFNSDVAIFNRALTATEKALITRYMQRAVPLLGANLVTNGTFDVDANWSKGTGWSIGSGVASKAVSASASVLSQAVAVAGSTYLSSADMTIRAASFWFWNGSLSKSETTNGAKSVIYVATASGLGFRGGTTSDGDIDNAVLKEIL